MPTIDPLATGNPATGAATAHLVRSPGDLRVTVRHEQGSWRVCGPDLEPLMFASGATAERAARRLAACLAHLGDDVRLEIHDRRDGLVAHIRVFADGPAGDVAAGRPRPLHA